ncbi:uncharacterized protein BCR38DRAFT_440160 [Pseudomassariella vexata]|uniref:Uncharacterized protein n=1 Tax=Pseudomassariella vexata TaxID=1141098 RepID=A0A1Y2DQ54_9PEZI|nr:uncharacterized protein BCR38DRAFT_440160 [Pseudomassariella vexata]ORY61423.1 hypothetical protein BCR38DRAFT_440160 [Pseudomassariella vexata]
MSLLASRHQAGTQRTLDSMVDVNQPQQQALHSRVSLRFNKQLNNLLIMDWLATSNLSFRILDNPRWRRQQLYNNVIIQEADLPHSESMIHLLLAEYRRAVTPIHLVCRNPRPFYRQGLQEVVYPSRPSCLDQAPYRI